MRINSRAQKTRVNIVTSYGSRTDNVRQSNPGRVSEQGDSRPVFRVDNVNEQDRTFVFGVGQLPPY